MRKLLVLAIATIAAMAIVPAGAAPIAEHKVFTDPVNGGAPLGPDATQPYMDLVAGYITETTDAIEFSWQVVLIDDLATNRLVNFYYEFAIGESLTTIVPCNAEGNRCFSLTAGFNEDNAGQGTLRSNCGGDVVITCQALPATVTVTIDAASNSVTASVPRADLGDPADGEVLVEQNLFQGIGAFQRLGAPWGGETSRPIREQLRPVNEQSPVGLPPSLSCSCIADFADLDELAYTFGTNQA